MTEQHEHKACLEKLNQNITRGEHIYCCLCHAHDGCELFELADTTFANDGTRHVRMNAHGQVEVEKVSKPAEPCKTCERCGKNVAYSPIHTCTPKPAEQGWEERFYEKFTEAVQQATPMGNDAQEPDCVIQATPEEGVEFIRSAVAEARLEGFDEAVNMFNNHYKKVIAIHAPDLSRRMMMMEFEEQRRELEGR